MAIARPPRLLKRQFGLYAKMTAVTVLGLCFVFVWSFFSSSSSTSVSARRDSFDDIAEPTSGHSRASNFAAKPRTDSNTNQNSKDDQKKIKSGSDSHGHERKKAELGSGHGKVAVGKKKEKEMKKSEEPEKQEEEGGEEEGEKEDDEEGLVVDGKEENSGGDEVEGDEGSDDSETREGEEEEGEEEEEEKESEEKSEKRKGKIKGPVFDPKAKYEWRLCSAKSKHNYIPCIDFETGSGKRAQSYRHTERSCPRSSLTCLVPLPRDGYQAPVPWPDSKENILYKNVGHLKLAAYVKKHSWVVDSGEYLTFPRNGSEVKGGGLHYLDSIAETVPDIEWGKNIRVVLDIGCTDSSFGATLLEKDVLTLTLGLKDDLVDLAQVALERGFPAIVSPLGRRRLPFPSGAFDAVHCAGCNVNWHSNGGIRLLEMNRILRPNGYFILSTKHDNIEDDEAMTELTASVCWNILVHKTDDISEVGVRIYQKPDSNDIYELRRKKVPAICKENENPDAAWYVPMKSCLHPIPTSIEEHGAEWPEEWPQRLETFPDWFGDKDKVSADAKHWSAITEKSYLTGMGIDWSKIRNVMDMKAIYGGFAAALSKEKVWVLNVVPVHAPDTLPVIFERGLIGTYHDWCEPFGTYPRSYDLLHADHLFSRLKNRCKKAVTIIVEMDRITRPGGWAIVRDKVEILDALEAIFKSLRWDIRMTFAKNKEGILCAQKTTWRP